MAALDVALSGAFVALHAVERFGKPRDDEFQLPAKSTTTAFRYYRSQLAYICFSIVLLALLMNVPTLLKLATNASLAPAPTPATTADLSAPLPDPEPAAEVASDKDPLPPSVRSLPLPYIAALLLTVLLPTFPVLKSVDDWILRRLYSWAEMPNRARELREWMRSQRHTPTTRSISVLRELARFNDTELSQLSQPLGARLVRSFSLVHELANSPQFVAFAGMHRAALQELCSESSAAAAEALFLQERGLVGPAAGRNTRVSDSLEARSFALEKRASGLAACALLGTCPMASVRLRELRAIGFEFDQPPETRDRRVLDLTMTATFVVLVPFLAMLLLRDGNDRTFGERAIIAVMIALVYGLAVGVPAALIRIYVHTDTGRAPDRRFHAAMYLGAAGLALAADLLLRAAVKSGIGIMKSESVRDGVVMGLKDLGATLSYSLITVAIALCTAVCIDWPPPSHEGRVKRRRLLEAALFGAASLTASLLAHPWLSPAPIGYLKFAGFVTVVGALLGYLMPTLYRNAALGAPWGEVKIGPQRADAAPGPARTPTGSAGGPTASDAKPPSAVVKLVALRPAEEAIADGQFRGAERI